MSGVATAVVVGSAITADANKDAAASAANARSNFPTQLVGPISQQLTAVADTDVASFQGDRVADFTGNQTAGIDMTEALAGRLGEQSQVSGAGFNQIASGANIGNNPFLERNIANMRENANIDFQRNQLPQIQNNAIAGGGIGGSRQGIAQGVALGDLNRSLNTQEGQMRQDQTNFDQGQQLQALINQGNILSGQTAAQDQLLGIGALQQVQNQAEIGGQREAFNEQNLDQFNRDQELLSILLGTPLSSGPVANQTNPLLGGLGAATTLSQLMPNQQPTPVQQPVATGIGLNATPGFNPASTAPQFING